MAIDIKRGASTADDPRVAARELYDAIHQPGAALTIFYCASSYDLGQLGAALSELFGPDASVIGCTTAAEITPQGYLEGAITGVSPPSAAARTPGSSCSSSAVHDAPTISRPGWKRSIPGPMRW